MSQEGPARRAGYVYDDGGLDLPAALDWLRTSTCHEVFVDEASASRLPNERPQLRRAIAGLQAGDVLVVPALETLATALPELVRFCASLASVGITLSSRDDAIACEGGFLEATRTLARMQRRVAQSRAELLRRRKGGARLDSSKSPGTQIKTRGVGRKPALSAAQIKLARGLLAKPGATVTGVAAALGVSRTTLYKHVSMPGSYGTDR